MRYYLKIKDVRQFLIDNDLTLDKVSECFDFHENQNYIKTEDFIRKAKKLFIGRSI